MANSNAVEKMLALVRELHAREARVQTMDGRGRLVEGKLICAKPATILRDDGRAYVEIEVSKLTEVAP